MVKFTAEDAVESPYGDPKNIPFTDDDLVIITDYQVKKELYKTSKTIFPNPSCFFRMVIMQKITMTSQKKKKSLKLRPSFTLKFLLPC